MSTQDREFKEFRKGALCTLCFVRQDTSAVMVGFFKRSHSKPGRWDGLLQPGFGGVVKPEPDKTPRQTIIREMGEEFAFKGKPLLEEPLSKGRVKICGGENGLAEIPSQLSEEFFVRIRERALDLPSGALQSHIGEQFSVHGFHVEIDERDARGLFYANMDPQILKLVNAFVTLVQISSHLSQAHFDSSFTNMLLRIKSALPQMSDEMSFPFFVPLDVAEAIVRFVPQLVMPHYVHTIERDGRTYFGLGPMRPNHL